MSDVDYNRNELPQLENYTNVEPFSRYLTVKINPAIKRICVHTKTKSRLNHNNLHISLWWRTLWWKTFLPYISSQNSNHSLDINFPASILFHFQVNFYIRDRPFFAVMVKTVLVWKVKKKIR